MKTITILHPFTPQAAGVVEDSVPEYHSQPHAKAMKSMVQRGHVCRMEYFTPRWFGYKLQKDNLCYQFYPVSHTLNGDHKKWKKQTSKACLKAYTKNAPDVTIINMSGHSSKFSYELSKVILNQGKHYIAMLGGRHYTYVDWLRDYYQKAHHILVHTQLQKQEMQALSLFKGCDIRVMPLGVDTSIFKAKAKKAQDRIQLLYVGRIVELKRIHLAIEIVNKLVKSGFNQVVLKIVGPVYSKHYQNELETLVIANNLSAYVFFEGFKEHNALVTYFNESDILLLPSESESFGMVVVESMSCGVPVAVIKGVVGPEEIITDQVDGLISILENYVSDVAALVLDVEKLNTMKTNACQKVINHYSIEQTSKVLLQSVNDALK
jgi:glycosyltransferase involved in cell wall biosynthesis